MPLDLEKTIVKTNQRLKKIQRGDEKTKKFYLIIFSAVAILLVVGLWLFYLNLNLPKLAETKKSVAGAEENGNSFFKTFSRGFIGLKDDFLNQLTKFKDVIDKGLESFKNQIGQSNEISIEGEKQNFVFEAETTTLSNP